MGANTDITTPEPESGAMPRYAAFISYAHEDEARAARLHKALETYRPPRELGAKREQLRPVFRDKAELTAHHSLPEKIHDAIKGSRWLIVLCSPAAKASHWVNEEIRLFAQIHGEENILCALVSDNDPQNNNPESAFPAALTEGGREPLAADLSGGREGFNFGTLQLAASMLGVGLDALVRRDAKRRKRVGTAVTLAALCLAAVMGASTQAAVEAKRAAEHSRAQSEALVEYMITDLKDKLEPVGRLDILNGVGAKVMDYYGSQGVADMDDGRIARRARAQHLLGQVALGTGKMDEAQAQIDAAYALTKEVLARTPDDTGAIFAHAQSAFWVGNVFHQQNEITKTAPYWQEYHDLAYQLYTRDKDNFDWVMEAAWGENNLGIVARLSHDYSAAISYYDRAITRFDQALALKPDSQLARNEKKSAFVGAEQALLLSGEYKEALVYKRKSLDMAESLVRDNPQNIMARANLAIGQSNLLWQYDLFLSPEERERLEPPQALANLIKHDPDNIDWTRQYYWHLILNARRGLEVGGSNSDYDMLIAALTATKDDALNPTMALYVDDLKARHYWAGGQVSKARAIIKDMAQTYSSRPARSATREILLARLYALIGKSAMAQDHARSYLDLRADKENQLDPHILLRRAQAYRILGQCQQASDTLGPLLDMADPSRPEIKSILACPT